MGKIVREEIENRMCECKFVLEIFEIIYYIYNIGIIIKVFFSLYI